ncbi:hypothetical protein NA56DRAFT_742537 [Hyaloscypha hepaticicola]|uniref:Uncharacterized protein n=1 Tax=Hyaloscypha hepaticicola TaxID=2082293 RepID=A0A2J6QQ50_9HELO|nr:hypothetical protein NA56DRAFT_742537 [Hyaloscypha hepaticicola]
MQYVDPSLSLNPIPQRFLGAASLSVQCPNYCPVLEEYAVGVGSVGGVSGRRTNAARNTMSDWEKRRGGSLFKLRWAPYAWEWGTVEREQNAECRLQMADGRCDGTVPMPGPRGVRGAGDLQQLTQATAMASTTTIIAQPLTPSLEHPAARRASAAATEASRSSTGIHTPAATCPDSCHCQEPGAAANHS